MCNTDQEWIDEQKRVIDQELAKGMSEQQRIDELFERSELLERRVAELTEQIGLMHDRFVAIRKLSFLDMAVTVGLGQKESLEHVAWTADEAIAADRIFRLESSMKGMSDA